MGRNWIPKFVCVCERCGWKGVRGNESKKCPRCGFWHPKRVEKTSEGGAK
jgi:hypothetical protein